MEDFIRLDRVSKIYGSGECEVAALQDVSLRIDRGEFVSILRCIIPHEDVISPVSRAEGLDQRTEHRRRIVFPKFLQGIFIGP